MLIYPQLAAGLAQFPLVKRLKTRTVENRLGDGSSMKSTDPEAGTIEWQLRYEGLSDGELAALARFFADAEGSLNSFTFVDPTVNLLQRSEEPADAAWTAAPQLQLTDSVPDPLGGTNAWRIRNTGIAEQAWQQVLNAPGEYLYCFSVYLRGDERPVVNLLAAGERRPVQVNTQWGRAVAVGTSNSGVTSVVFGIELPAGGTVEVYGPQAEPQVCPSCYRRSTTGGIYEGARLRDDRFSFRTTDRNRHSATVNVIYANHL